MKKMMYATSLYYPSRYANRLQVLQTAEQLARQLGNQFVFGCNQLSEAGDLYTHAHIDFHSHKSPVIAWKQLRYAIKNGVDTIYSREYTILFMMFVYNKLFFRTPLTFVLEVHDMYDDFRFAFMLQRVAHVFCLTRGLAEDLRTRMRATTPITILPDGVDLNSFRISEDRGALREKYGVPRDAHIISYVGSVGVHSWKGVDVFLESYEAVRAQSVHYVVAGVRDEDIETFRLAHTGKAITFFGWRTRREVAEIMALSDALVLPNKSGPRVAERYTSPMKLFEYMASGVPIIASDLPSTREVLDESCAFLVSPSDPGALARAVDQIFADPVEALRRTAAATQRVQNYSWESRAQKIILTLSSPL